MSFARGIADFRKQAVEGMKKAVESSVIDACSLLTLRSPVFSGRFRANWQASVGAPSETSIPWFGQDVEFDYKYIPGADKLVMIRSDLYAPMPSPGSDFAIQNMISVAPEAYGKVFYYTNNVTYGYELEMGKSDQAPQGMVRLTALEFPEIVRKNIQK